MENLKLDSDEEKYFYWWAKELQDLGFIKSITLQPEPFNLLEPLKVEYFEQMKTKSKYVNEEIMKGHIYTPDVLIEWSDETEKMNIVETDLYSDLRKKKRSSLQFLMSQTLKGGKRVSYVEVKPSFDQNNMTRLAKINQKWVYDKYGIYVNIVIPEKHFDKTFTPERFLKTNISLKPRKIKYKNITKSVHFLGLEVNEPKF